MSSLCSGICSLRKKNAFLLLFKARSFCNGSLDSYSQWKPSLSSVKCAVIICHCFPKKLMLATFTGSSGQTVKTKSIRQLNQNKNPYMVRWVNKWVHEQVSKQETDLCGVQDVHDAFHHGLILILLGDHLNVTQLAEIEVSLLLQSFLLQCQLTQLQRNFQVTVTVSVPSNLSTQLTDNSTVKVMLIPPPPQWSCKEIQEGKKKATDIDMWCTTKREWC